MASRDRPVLEALQAFLGTGSITDRAPERDGWLPKATFSINSHLAHHRVTIPFAETFLLPSAKRRQFEQWRRELDEYERAHPTRYGRGPSTCRIDGCDRPVRGRGLCRRHYYAETGY